MEDQLLTILAAIAVLAILVAAFATDWRLGLAVAGVALLVLVLRLAASRPPAADEVTG